MHDVYYKQLTVFQPILEREQEHIKFTERENSSVVNSNNVVQLWHVILEGNAPLSELLAIERILSFTQSVHYEAAQFCSNEN